MSTAKLDIMSAPAENMEVEKDDENRRPHDGIHNVMQTCRPAPVTKACHVIPQVQSLSDERGK